MRKRTIQTGLYALRLFLLGLLVCSMTACGGFKIVRIPIPIPTFGLGGGEKKHPEKPTAKPEEQPLVSNFLDVGTASWYGSRHQGKRTASGEKFDKNSLTAAHPTLPFNTKVKVTNIQTGERVIVRINDRGPFNDGRIIDVSQAAARKLGFEKQGTTRVRIEAPA